jgi:hypothetical protein
MDSIFYARLRIQGAYGEICIDSAKRVMNFDFWYWETITTDIITPTFNNGNGPHCMQYFYLCGDVNRDMRVNIADAVRIISYIFTGGFVPDPMIAADANCDGNINVSDVVVILNYIFRTGHEPCDYNNDGIPDC